MALITRHQCTCQEHDYMSLRSNDREADSTLEQLASFELAFEPDGTISIDSATEYMALARKHTESKLTDRQREVLRLVKDTHGIHGANIHKKRIATDSAYRTRHVLELKRQIENEFVPPMTATDPSMQRRKVGRLTRKQLQKIVEDLELGRRPRIPNTGQEHAAPEETVGHPESED